MQFARSLRQRVMLGEITLSVRVWKQPRVRVGGHHRLGSGAVVIDAVDEIGCEDISAALAVESGFENVETLMNTARHGTGERVFVVRFHYEPDD